ncbi:MAG TPA: hypothetical protein VM012_07525 [Flavitalea sp.]|nr:hypothetical protein [Flavitalea sp.]
MPYYYVTVKLKNGNILSGIREMDNLDIDYAWQYFRNRAITRFGDFSITAFEVMMLSKHSNQVKAYIRKEKKPPRIEGWGDQFQ